MLCADMLLLANGGGSTPVCTAGGADQDMRFYKSSLHADERQLPAQAALVACHVLDFLLEPGQHPYQVLMTVLNRMCACGSGTPCYILLTLHWTDASECRRRAARQSMLGCAQGSLDLNLGGYDGLALRVRGDGQTFKVNLKTADQENTPEETYQASFDTRPGVHRFGRPCQLIPHPGSCVGLAPREVVVEKQAIARDLIRGGGRGRRMRAGIARLPGCCCARLPGCCCCGGAACVRHMGTRRCRPGQGKDPAAASARQAPC